MAKHRVKGRLNNGDQAGRRASDLPVRQWLKLGAASAGMGAALLGYSLMGPGTGTASADTTNETSSSQPAGSAADSSAPGSDRDADASVGDDRDSDPAPEQDAAAEAEDAEAEDAEAEDAADTEAEAEAEAEAADAEAADADDSAPAADTTDDTVVSADTDDAESDTDSATDGDAAARSTANLTSATTAADAPAEPVPAPPWLAPRRTYAEVVADVIDRWTARTEARIESLSVDDETKARMLADFLAMRRSLFNQAPTVAPVQLTGLLTGAITGRVGAEDADGDEIVYRILRGPRLGSLVLNDDGTYTYTPGEGFDGVDTFLVRAVDVGPHLNLLNIFRPIGTRASNLINQDAIRFEFSFVGDDWTEERRAALAEVARNMQEYFRVERPVTLTYDVDLEDPNDPDRGLASASSDYISKLPGYWQTVVQHKLLTGRDANGSKADGNITWNFADHQWGLDDVSAEEYDFVSTAIHELMHSFGFLSSLDEPGENRDRARTEFDRHIVTARGTRPFGAFASWSSRNDPKLVGEDGGLYFGGRNAIAAYGGLVPLFTPDPWDGGSSLHHLDDFTFTGDNQQIMNAKTGMGLVTRVFSDFELGIFRDLGYIAVMPETPPYAAGFVGLVFLLRRRRSAGDSAPRD
ncbi:hypothetical protein FHR72_000509 [Mycolicibacterium iranicum]|uniref:Uncharacterized protein n=1 Tax=Mycolicibacterium iranicum TaxID=912594 RepID=A0A839Q776_MYCIR|nr:Ig-like domain-containing protein [Mycolicibacterium iranicum]MBB2989052.1 hypothetical protein [Mycolicibacterium iranicum]